MSLFKYKKIKSHKIEVRAKDVNNTLIATIEEAPDGHFYLWIETQMNAAWTSDCLRELADRLDKYNKEWNIIETK